MKEHEFQMEQQQEEKHQLQISANTAASSSSSLSSCLSGTMDDTNNTTKQPNAHTEEGEEVGISKEEDEDGVVEGKNEEDPPLEPKSILQHAFDFYFVNQFLIHVLLAIGLAKAFPHVAEDYLAPKITAGWIAVIIIFFLSGIGLRTDEFAKAFQQLYFNIYVQIVNFGLVSAVVFVVTRFLVHVEWVTESLADGMVICACLPISVNTVIVLTASAEGDEALSVFHTTFSNIVGIFLSPALILLYLGSKSDIALADVFGKLALKVIVPLAVGQIVQKTSYAVVKFAKRNKLYFKKAQETSLVFIIYTVFCNMFIAKEEEEERSHTFGEIFLMIFFQFVFLITFLAYGWYTLGYLFPDQPKMRVMGTLGCPSKTIALGIPLINSIYEGNPELGIYALPLIVWHPMKLVVGTLLVPRMARYVRLELERLGHGNEEEGTKKQQQQKEQEDTPLPANDLEVGGHEQQSPPK